MSKKTFKIPNKKPLSVIIILGDLHMKLKFFIFLNKLVTFICHVFHRNGSVYPGFIIYDIFRQKDILEKIKYPKLVIAVTGSSGKGSTSDLINQILTKNGYKVCFNKEGSNGVLAATTLILNNCDSKGNLLADCLLLECDERHLKLIFKKNKMSHLIITNITRDQPARNGHPDLIYKEIDSAIGPSTTLILNADDPLVNKLSLTHQNKIVTFGLDYTCDSFKTSNFNIRDHAYCPKCHTKLEYSYYHYGHLGNYECPKCHFKRGVPDFFTTDVDYQTHTIKINNEDVHLNKDALYAVYYTTAAVALGSTINIEIDKILNILNSNTKTKRGKTSHIDNRLLTMLETKNENHLSYYQSLKFITNQTGKKTIILGFDNVSRRYRFNDISWLWDVSFELLNDKNIDKIFVIGRFRYDIMTRLKIANIDLDKIIIIDNLNTLIKEVKEKSIGDIYTMVCFDMTYNIQKLIKEDEEQCQQ